MKNCFIFILTILIFHSFSFSQTPDTLWYENWEGNWIMDWHVDAGTWEVGTPTSGPDSAFEGLNCAATVLAGNYSEPVDSRLIRHTSFVVPSADQNPRLRFWQWYSISTNDYGVVQIKVGNGDWITISPNYIRTSCNMWHHCFVDLSEYADSTVQIAFYFHSRASWNGGNVSSGWYIDDIALLTGPIEFHNPEDWESGFGYWYSDHSMWQVGTPTSGPNTAHGGNNCAATILDGNYFEPRDTRLISPKVKLPPANENPGLIFWHWFSFSSNDYGRVDIRTNHTDWVSISNSYTSTSSGVWTNVYLDLSSYADSTVQFAFYIHTAPSWNGGNVSSGWYIDDIQILPFIVGIKENDYKILPTKFTLLQNYPNPFNPVTRIPFTLPKASHVKIEIFNLLGERVAVLLDERKPAGVHSVTFDGRSLPSGVYYYRLETDKGVAQTRKLVLLK